MALYDYRPFHSSSFFSRFMVYLLLFLSVSVRGHSPCWRTIDSLPWNFKMRYFHKEPFPLKLASYEAWQRVPALIASRRSSVDPDHHTDKGYIVRFKIFSNILEALFYKDTVWKVVFISSFAVLVLHHINMYNTSGRFLVLVCFFHLHSFLT